MKIQFVYGATKGAFSSAVMASALNAGKTLRIYHPFVSFEVSDWTEFLDLVWSACAECSRDQRGQEIVKPLPVTINYNGRSYYTKIWFDQEAKGLRYVSLN